MKLKINLPVRQRIYIFPVVAILMVVVSGVALIWPWFSKAMQVRAQALEIGRKTSSMEEKIAFLNSTDEAELSRQLSVVEAAAPVDKDVTPEILGIKGAATSVGALLVGIRVSPGLVSQASESGKQEEVAVAKNILNFSVEVAGTKDQILAFVDELLRRAPLLEADSMSLAEEKGSDILKAAITVKGYYVTGGSVALGSLESPISQLSESEKALLTKLDGLARGFSGLDDGGTSGTGRENPFE